MSMRRRKPFVTESYYLKSIDFYDSTEARWANEKFQTDSEEEERSARFEYLKAAALKGLLLSYSAGEAIDDLVIRLERLVRCYECYQNASAIEEGEPHISPLSIAIWPEEYEECVQVVSFCILLGKKNLLERFVKLIDQAGYFGKDSLLEDLLIRVLPNRLDVDGWYHAHYTKLIKSIYADTKEHSAALLKEYCDEWYASFGELQATWHNSHLEIDGDDGNYVGYWALEAAAIAYLYDIDDSKITSMVYPQDLVTYARNHKNYG